MRVKEIEEAITTLKKQLDELEEQLEEAIPRQKLKCNSCEKYNAISELKAIVTFDQRQKFKGCHFVCPNCQWPNKKSSRLKELIENYSHGFRTVTEERHDNHIRDA